MHLQSYLVQNLYYFSKIRSYFKKLVQNFELKRVGGAHKCYQFAPLAPNTRTKKRSKTNQTYAVWTTVSQWRLPRNSKTFKIRNCNIAKKNKCASVFRKLTLSIKKDSKLRVWKNSSIDNNNNNIAFFPKQVGVG